jgi:cysteine-rich repeat protein
VLNQCSTEPEPADPHPVCGDGKVEGNEVCDDGKFNATYGHCSASCDGKHLFCGDGRKDGAEECDDGNKKPHDGCTNDCKLVPDELDAGPGPMDTASRVGSVPAGSGRRAAGAAGAVGSATLPATAQVAPVVPAAGAAGPVVQTRPKDSDGCGCHAVGTRTRNRSRGVLLLAFCAAVLLRPTLRRRGSRRRR